MNAPLPDWIGILATVACVGGSIAFGLIMYARRDGGRAFRTATNDLLRDVADRLQGEYQPAGPVWSMHRSMRVFGAASGTRSGLEYEVSRYPFNVEDDEGRPYIAIRSPVGVHLVSDSGQDGGPVDPDLEKALGRRVARRLPADATGPLLALVRDSTRVSGYRSTLLVLAPSSLSTLKPQPTATEFASWVDRVLGVAEALSALDGGRDGGAQP